MERHIQCMFAITAVPCFLPSKYAFIWSSHKLYCLNERMESLFCKWKQLKVVVNIPVDMYHFCINKFTLVESVFVFEIFSGFCVLCNSFIHCFPGSRICCHYPAHLSYLEVHAMLCPYKQKKVRKGVSCAHRPTACCWIWPPDTAVLSGPAHVSQDTAHTYYKDDVFAVKIISTFLPCCLSLATSCRVVLGLLFLLPQPLELKSPEFMMFVFYWGRLAGKVQQSKNLLLRSPTL